MPLDTEFPTGIRCAGTSGDTAANAEDQLCEYGGFTYSYNTRGQLQSKSDGMVTTSYSYDGLGRLQRVTEPGMEIHYVLDALGRRIGKLRDGNLEKGWLYADALNPIAELDSAGNVRATLIYGTRAHVPDAMVMTDGTVYRFITDHLGSVRLVVDAATGEVAERIDYDAFGRVLSDTNPGFQPFGFAGGLYDDDTGLVRFGARDYDAHSGRWTAKDPVLFVGQDANLYAYVHANPVNLIDPTGLDCESNFLDLLEQNVFGRVSFQLGYMFGVDGSITVSRRGVGYRLGFGAGIGVGAGAGVGVRSGGVSGVTMSGGLSAGGVLGAAGRFSTSEGGNETSFMAGFRLGLAATATVGHSDMLFEFDPPADPDCEEQLSCGP